MPDYNTALQAVIDSVATKAATAQPNDLAYLGKALEAVAPGSSASLIVQLGTSQKQAVNDAGTAQVAAVNQAGATQAQAVNDVGTAKVAAVNTAGNAQVTAINAAGSSLIETVVDFAAASVASAPSAMKKEVRIIGAAALDFTVINLTLPDATTLTEARKNFRIRNETYAIVQVKNADGANLFKISPRAIGKLWTGKTSATDWRGTDSAIPVPTQRLAARYPDYQSNAKGRFSIPSWYDGSYTYQPSGVVNMAIALDASGAPAAMVGHTIGYNGSTTQFRGYLTWGSLGSGALATSVGAATFSFGGTSWAQDCLTFPPLKYGQIFGISTNTNQNPSYLSLYYANTTDGSAGFLAQYQEGNSVYYHNAHGMAFGGGDYAAAVIRPSASGSSTYVIARYKMNAAGTPTAAGSIAISASDAVVQVSDKYLLTYDGTSSRLFDMTVAGTTLNPVSTWVPAELTGGGGSYTGLYFGNGVFSLNNGIYKYGGGTTLTKVSTSGAAIASGFSSNTPYMGAVFSPVDGVCQVGRCTYYLTCNGGAAVQVSNVNTSYVAVNERPGGTDFTAYVGSVGDSVIAVSAITYNYQYQAYFDVTVSPMDRISAMQI